jgi:hypothetical protein
MRLSSFTAVVGLLCTTVLATSEATDKLYGKDPMKILKQLDKKALHNLKEAGSSGTCTLKNASRRKDW